MRLIVKRPTARQLTIAVFGCAAFEACHRVSYYEAPKLQGVSFEAYSALRGPSLDSVGIWSRLIATEAASPTIERGGCPPSAQFELVSGNPHEIHKWDYFAMLEARSRQAGSGFGCLLYLLVGPITPEMKQSALWFSIAIRDVLGDSLPAGRYRITLFLPIVGSKPIPAGFLDLRRSASR
jgi:hypothetical protein